jgi:hypothetical protein
MIGKFLRKKSKALSTQCPSFRGHYDSAAITEPKYMGRV